MSKPEKVGKDFSVLQVEQRIELLAAKICEHHFRGQTLQSQRPRQGTQVDRIWKMVRLDRRQQTAWRYFCADIEAAEGKSGPVTSSYGEATDQGNGADFRIPVARENASMTRLKHLFMNHLDRHERALLSDLTQDYLRGSGHITLESIGLFRSGYRDEESARASGVTHVQNLLSRVAGFYGI